MQYGKYTCENISHFSWGTNVSSQYSSSKKETSTTDSIKPILLFASKPTKFEHPNKSKITKRSMHNIWTKKNSDLLESDKGNYLILLIENVGVVCLNEIWLFCIWIGILLKLTKVIVAEYPKEFQLQKSSMVPWLKFQRIVFLVI